MRLRLTLCLVVTFIINCLGYNEPQRPITFKNVRICLISQVFKSNLTVFVSEARNLRDFIISNKTDTIRINNQEIPMLYERSVTDIPNVAVFDLSSNGIQGIEEGAFGNLGFVQALNLSSNLIRVVRSEVFTHVDVRFLFLAHNRIFQIEEGAFNHLDHLYFIDLSYNRIRNWSWRWFRGTPFKGINMRHNLLENLPEDSFRFIDDLELPHDQKIFHHLLFGHNSIKSVDKYSLPRLKKIIHFDLSHNKLETIEVGTFNNVESLDNIDLSNNLLTYLDRNVFKFTEVGYVNLKANYLVSIDAEFIPMVNLDLNPLVGHTKKRWMEWRNKYGYALESPQYSS
ncbi:chaoptin-like [Coccinella septempunctata]|uniref:chaoptin-like n=1 Tax=Coccinella septempunctata TaxID=41139 RepID=UPI001D07A94B|nr:chaoptin-like [Coccinella septempunctata]